MAFSLKTSLTELGMDFEDGTTWKECDNQYENLNQQLQMISMDSIVQRPLSEDLNIIAMGAVLVEAMSAAFWSNGQLVK